MRLALVVLPPLTLAIVLVMLPPMPSVVRQSRGIGEGVVNVDPSCPVIQTFRTDGARIGGVGLTIATYDGSFDGRLRVEVGRIENPEAPPQAWQLSELAESEVDSSELTDWQTQVFRFDAIPTVPSDVYYLKAVTAGRGPQAKAALACSAQDTYPGQFYDGQVQPKDLTFRVYGADGFVSSYPSSRFLGVPPVLLVGSLFGMSLLLGLALQSVVLHLGRPTGSLRLPFHTVRSMPERDVA